MTPRRIAGITATEACGSGSTYSMWTTRTAHRMADTPAASPLRPSSQLTVLMQPMNQKTVTASTSHQGNPSGPKRRPGPSGLLTCLMKIRPAMAIRPAPIWIRYCHREAKSKRSSMMPQAAQKALPPSKAHMRRSSSGSWLTGSHALNSGPAASRNAR